MAYLEATGISKQFGDRPVLQDVNLTLAQGSFTALLGLSGCGKTTLLRIMAGLERADSGSLRLAGQDITHCPAPERGLGLVFQSYALFPHLNVFDNVAYGLKMRRESDLQQREKVGRVLAKVNLAAKAGQSVAELSGGEQQRVALARAIVTEPRVLLLDEPLSNLDHSLRLQARTELKRLQQELGITTVYVTHDQAEALALSDCVAVLNAGRVVQFGTPQAVYYAPTNAFTARLVGHHNLLSPALAQALLGRAIGPGQVLALRPDCLRLARASQFTGVVVQAVLFTGATTEYVLAVQGQVVRACGPSAGSDGLRPGDHVTVSAAAGEGRELADEAAN